MGILIKRPRKGARFEISTGQVWQMEGSTIKIDHVGKRLVHYKHYRGELKRVPVSLSAKDTLEQFLARKKAVLLLE